MPGPKGPSGLNHPTITIRQILELQATHGGPTPARVTPIDMGRPPGGNPYRLVWLRGPDGASRLYQLIEEPASPTTSPSQEDPT